MYSACLARRLRPASVRQYLNIVRVMHLEAGLSNPLKDSWFISSTLKGIDRAKGTAANRKSPVTPDILLRIKKDLKMSDRDDIVFWAACLMFFGLFRKANLFAKQKFDADKHFTRDSFVLNANCSLTLTVCVRWSKTIQCREREIGVTLPALHPHPCAPCQRSAKRSALLSISPQRRQPSPCQERCLTGSRNRSPSEGVTCQGTVSGEGPAGHWAKTSRGRSSRSWETGSPLFTCHTLTSCLSRC